MSRNAQVEEVYEDSDPEEVAPNPTPSNIPHPSILSPNAIPSPSSIPMRQPPDLRREIPRHFQCLYPVYFDRTRTRAEGRKVGAELAVENPLARDIVDAVQLLGLSAGFEPEKLHPKDWANPGRVRVLLKDEKGHLVHPDIKNSWLPLLSILSLYVLSYLTDLEHHLYILVAQYLKTHPTTEKSPYRLRFRGFPTPEKLPDAPQAPRGWKIGTILPLHSPAYSGGGVSENPFKEAMAEMQNMQGMPGMPSMPGMPGMGDESPAGGAGGSEKKKKDKKKGKA